MSALWAALVDLVLPAACAGCAARLDVTGGFCGDCAAALAGARPARVRPDPEPPGLPPTFALAGYGGALSAAILAYKERGRYGLARVLGDRLADVVRAAAPGAAGVLLIPVPATAAAARQRHGDHMTRLARQASGALRRQGIPAGVAVPLRALPRPDSAGLSAIARAVVATEAFRVRDRRIAPVRDAVAAGVTAVLVDDVITTGATLAAVGGRLRSVGVEVPRAAVLAATARRHPGYPKRGTFDPGGTYSE